MWTSVYMAQSLGVAQQIRLALEGAGIAVKVVPFGSDEGEEKCFEILVPGAEVEQAHNIIIDLTL